VVGRSGGGDLALSGNTLFALGVKDMVMAVFAFDAVDFGLRFTVDVDSSELSGGPGGVRQ
jgi:hypothetical protein